MENKMHDVKGQYEKNSNSKYYNPKWHRSLCCGVKWARVRGAYEVRREGSVLCRVHWLETLSPGRGIWSVRAIAQSLRRIAARRYGTAGRQETAKRARRLFRETRALAKRERKHYTTQNIEGSLIFLCAPTHGSARLRGGGRCASG